MRTSCGLLVLVLVRWCSKGILSVPTGLKESARLQGALAAGREWSDDENAEAEAENRGGTSVGLDLFADLSIAGTASSSSGSGAASNSARVGGGKLKKGQISRRRAADSGSDSD